MLYVCSCGIQDDNGKIKKCGRVVIGMKHKMLSAKKKKKSVTVICHSGHELGQECFEYLGFINLHWASLWITKLIHCESKCANITLTLNLFGLYSWHLMSSLPGLGR